MWLLTRGKPEKAQRTLGKLRGWVSHDKCLNEFQEMMVFTSNNGVPSNFVEQNTTRPYCRVYMLVTFYSFTDRNEDDDRNSESSWKQLFQPSVMKPFRLMLIYFFFSNLLSGTPYSPYLVEVFTKFDTGVDVNWTVVSVNHGVCKRFSKNVFKIRIARLTVRFFFIIRRSRWVWP